jgi:NADH pyrophosphatase NudC (nudix superfamily)
MAYSCNLGTGQQVFVDNRGRQTIVTTMGVGPGQQQQSSTGFSTGRWMAPPMLYRTANGFVLQLESETGHHYVQLQGSSMSAMAGPPSLGNAQGMQMQQAMAMPEPSLEPLSHMPAMEPMQPMQPMKMGDMEMQANPMQMRMGNMAMSMGSATSAASAAEHSPASGQKKFCSQCGSAVQPSDRFCSNCGHQLG